MRVMERCSPIVGTYEDILVLIGKYMKSRTIPAAVVNTFNSGPWKVGILGISRALSLRSAENRAPGRVQSQSEDPGCGYGSPSTHSQQDYT